MDAMTHARYPLTQQRIERVASEAEVRRRNAERLAALTDAPRTPVSQGRAVGSSPVRRRRRRLAAGWDLAG